MNSAVWPIRRLWGLVCFLIIIISGSAVWAVDVLESGQSTTDYLLQFTPEPDPPKVDLGDEIGLRSLTVSRAAAPATEWTYHKTADGAHPDGNEQQMMWLMNRARSDPEAEGAWLAATGNPQIENAISWFDVDTDVLRSEFDGYPAKPPAAFDVRLYNAAKAHSDYLISNDEQSHDGEFSRIADAGFKHTSAAGIVFAYSKNAVYGHAGFNIDWGNGTDGTQDPPGHRYAIMSVNADYSNTGYAVVSETDAGTAVGPLVITGNMCKASTNYADHYNRFLVGTVWVDANDNSMYDPGEGVGDVTVMPDHGTYYAITSHSGGYAVPMLAAGDYHIMFSGGSLSGQVTKTVTVESMSVLLDLVVGEAEIPAITTGAATDITSSSAILNGSVIPNGTTTSYYFEYGATTAYGSVTTSETADQDTAVSSQISGLSHEATYHFRLVGTNAAGTNYGEDNTFITLSNAAQREIEAFVTRFYRECLSREPDESGLEDWVSDLLAGTRAGSDVARGFILSQEFAARNVSDDDYLVILYSAFFDRNADDAGRAYWLDRLQSGESRESVLNGFIYAQEFFALCDEYGITPVSAGARVEEFVSRFYRECLEREPDANGLDYWVSSLLEGSRTGADVAEGFILSQEFMSRNTSNEEFLTILYEAFFNRDPDSDGYDYWLASLASGANRQDVLSGFVYAAEFANLCAEYQISPF